MTTPPRDTDNANLLARAATGDKSAEKQLLTRHRDRLRRMVTVHLDRRLAPRLDPSDVVQEAMAEASQKLPDYLREPPVAFYPWLRQIAWQRLVHLQQRHVHAQKRSVLREQPWNLDLPDESVADLADRLVTSGSSPSRHMIRKELYSRVRSVLESMPASDRQVLTLRYLEQLSAEESAQVIGINLDAFMKRHFRAIRRIRRLLDAAQEESS
jgi:RNA polymerase sigma-70 factor (ECF subfamily)